MSKVTGYEYKSSIGSRPAIISHEQYSDGGNVFVAFLPESNESKSFHSLQNAEGYLKENGFIIGENVTKTDEIPAKTLKSLNEEFTSSMTSSKKFGRGSNAQSARDASQQKAPTIQDVISVLGNTVSVADTSVVNN